VYSEGMTSTENWKVTMRTGEASWSIITVEAADHVTAINEAQRLVGGQFSRIE
jgi:hypothetical protein